MIAEYQCHGFKPVTILMKIFRHPTRQSSEEMIFANKILNASSIVPLTKSCRELAKKQIPGSFPKFSLSLSHAHQNSLVIAV